MAVAKDALAIVIVLGVTIFASGVAIYYYQSRRHQKRATALKNSHRTYDVENQAMISLKREPQATMWRCKSDAGPRAKQPSANRAALPRSQSAGATVGLARPALAHLPRWSRPARRT
ncbi:hypothetical protein ACKVWC_001784 [Pyricularia oryzae]